MLHLERSDYTRLLLFTLVGCSIICLLAISTAIVSPWYKVIDFESDAASWQCSLLVERNAFYSWKSCSCDQWVLPDTAFLPDDWCTDSFYDWRNCENCDTLGCACSLELRIWNATMGFVLLSFACVASSTVILALQISEKMKSLRAQVVNGIVHILYFIALVYLVTAFALFFRINSAIAEDYGNRCVVGFGACDSFSGSTEGNTLKFHNDLYQFNQSWGPMFGFWMLPVGIVMAVIVEILHILYTIRVSRDPHNLYESIK